MTKKATCKTCGLVGGDEFRMPDGTHKCPKCGSSDLHVAITLQAQVNVHESLGMKGRRQDAKKAFREVKVGDDLRKSDGKWMSKERAIDREADRYDETVTDPETGDVVHECHEPLSKHTDRGSAKLRILGAKGRKPDGGEQT
jgi:uncharacterized Zn finger protein (UPF0148 family)